MALEKSIIKPKRPIIFGEVLYDCFPDGRQILGGAPFNVAWNLQAFGVNPFFISRVGDDKLGKKIQHAMKDWGMNVSGLQIDNELPTGTVEVTIDNNEPSYDIVNHRAWDNITYDASQNQGEQCILYYGSLASRNRTSANTLQKIKQNAACQRFVDVNLRSPWWDKETVLRMIKDCETVKINHEELKLISPINLTFDTQIEHLMDEYNIQSLIVTCGADGAIATSKSGEKIEVKPEKTINFVDTVGAGDAFSSALLLGIIKQWPLKTTLEHAQYFASCIVGVRGATVEDKAFYSSIISDWN